MTEDDIDDIVPMTNSLFAGQTVHCIIMDELERDETTLKLLTVIEKCSD